MLNKVMRVVIGLLALAGMVVSAMALHVHNMDPSQAPPCAVTEKFDCGTVNHSRYAVFPPKTFDEDASSRKVHVPVATIGIVGYALMFLFAALGRWWVVLQLAEIGFGAACFLTYLEAYVLEKWCIYCLCSQGIVTMLLLATVVALVLRRRETKRIVYAN
jgi:vitamin-K-epoxide reductase (warfarin-sensitive)